MKTIKVELTESSIDNAIDELRDYREGLKDRLKVFVENLVTAGVQVAKLWVASGQGDGKNAFVNYLINPSGDIVKAEIFLKGKDAVFVEFGAGIHYNNGNAHPKAAEFGFGVGTYPGQTHAINPGYWWYRDDGKNLHLSLGTQATMPMYHAAETIRNNLIYEAIGTLVEG